MMLSYILLKATNPREDLVTAGHRHMTPPPPTARWRAIKRLSSAAMLQPALLLEGGLGHPPVTQRGAALLELVIECACREWPLLRERPGR